MSDAPVPLTFVLPGFSKCGTTTLADLLSRHPDLLLPTKLEPWFFSLDDYADRWDWYRGLFPDAGRYPAVGDDSTQYTSFQVVDAVADRLAGLYPELRVLFLARDPAARIESSYREFHHSGPRFGLDAPFPLHEAMTRFPQLLRDSRYTELVDRYRRRFPDDQLKVVFFEDLVADPQATLDACFEFLGVRPGVVSVTTAPRHNDGAGKLHDTRLLRRLRNTPVVGPQLARVPIPVQDRHLAKLRLRRRFDRPVAWTEPALRRLRDEVAPDAREFLARYGEPAGGWRRLRELAWGAS